MYLSLANLAKRLLLCIYIYISLTKIIAVITGMIGLVVTLYVGGIMYSAVSQAQDQIMQNQIRNNPAVTNAYNTAKAVQDAQSTAEDAQDIAKGITNFMNEVVMPAAFVGAGITGGFAIYRRAAN
jgi:hypothetical protein